MLQYVCEVCQNELIPHFLLSLGRTWLLTLSNNQLKAGEFSSKKWEHSSSSLFHLYYNRFTTNQIKLLGAFLANLKLSTPGQIAKSSQTQIMQLHTPRYHHIQPMGEGHATYHTTAAILASTNTTEFFL